MLAHADRIVGRQVFHSTAAKVCGTIAPIRRDTGGFENRIHMVMGDQR
jgi:hypothetical protein